MKRQTLPDEARVGVLTADLIISYPGKQFSRAKGEILRTLRRLGDPAPSVKNTSVWGIALASTILDPRDVIRRLHEQWRDHPTNAFRFAIKWVPAEYWAESQLTAIRQVIENQITDRIGADETWAMRVHKRRWEKYHTQEIVTELAAAIPRKVDLTHPDWLVWVDVIGNRTAVSLLRPDEFFSVLGKAH